MDEKYHSRLIRVLLCVGDVFLLNLVFRLSKWFNALDHLEEGDANSFFLIFGFSWIATGLLSRIYEISKYSLLRSISINLFGSIAYHALLMTFLLLKFNVYTISVYDIMVVYMFTGILMSLSRVLYKLIWKYIEFSGFDQRKVVIVGTTWSGWALHNFFSTHDPSGYIFKGFFDDNPNTSIISGGLVRGKIDDLDSYCERESIDEIYFTLPLTNKMLLERLSRYADDHCIYFRIAPDFSEVVNAKHNVYVYDSVPVLTIRKEPLDISVNAGLKRLFDIAFALFVILFIFPFIVPVIAFAIKVDSEGPVIFKQLRPGKKNKLFECYKFRTMYVNGSTDVMAVKNDPRITRVGAFLRKTSLDELPQFFNVLLGDMSIVGPRPNLVSQLEEYSKSITRYKVRHFVTPGITGYAQVNGLRGEIQGKEMMEKRVEYDVKYMENWSMMLDLRIIFLTIRKMIKGDKHAY